MSKQLESDDPYTLVGVVVPETAGHDSTAEMARTFVEEFALMGYSPGLILRLFKRPFYLGAHMIYRQRGEEFVRSIIAETLIVREGK